MQVSCSNAFYDLGTTRMQRRGKKQIDLAEEFGVSKVLIIPGELSENEAAALNALSASKEQTDSYMSENASIQNMAQALKELVSYGQEKGILVTLEDFDGPVQPFARRRIAAVVYGECPGPEIYVGYRQLRVQRRGHRAGV